MGSSFDSPDLTRDPVVLRKMIREAKKVQVPFGHTGYWVEISKSEARRMVNLYEETFGDSRRLSAYNPFGVLHLWREYPEIDKWKLDAEASNEEKYDCEEEDV